jgi:plasmid stabilization system protein ParE
VKPVRFSVSAEADLVEIGLSVARDNPARAHSFVDELEAKYEALGALRA